MWPKALLVICTVLLITIGLDLYERDNVADFIPVILSLERGRMVSYDFFLVLMILVMRLLYQANGVSWPVFKNSLRMIWTKHPFGDLVAMTISAYLALVWISPILRVLLEDPLSDLHDSPNSVRRVAMMSLTLFWGLILSLIYKGRGVPYQQVQQQYAQPGYGNPP